MKRVGCTIEQMKQRIATLPRKKSKHLNREEIRQRIQALAALPLKYPSNVLRG